MLFNIVYAFMLRGTGAAFAQVVAACLLMAATFPVFFIWTYPGNVATQNWTVVPDNWGALRTQWEYSHAANAVLTFAAFCCLALAAGRR